MRIDTRKALYFNLLRLRRIEEAIAANYSRGQMRCAVHLSLGQEAVAVGVCAQLGVEDVVYSTHRCHAHYLAKGGELDEMIAELHGKATGCAGGKGGSMHLVAPEVGMLGSSALVGGTLPLAVGSALAFTQANLPLVAVAFFGDGATEEGLFWESLNFAALKKLPVLFVCENNLYATYSHQRARQARCNLVEKAAVFGASASAVDGNDVEAVFEAASQAVRQARAGNGPVFLECATYRVRDHVGPGEDTHLGYRSKEEVESWKQRCPLALQEKRLGEAGALNEDERQFFEQSVREEIEQAFAFAERSPWPQPSAILEGIYA